MACLFPRSMGRTESGDTTFDVARGDVVSTWEVPCGKCMPCRIIRADELSTRLAHEMSRWPISASITLTYANGPDGSEPFSLSLRDYQLWAKRLRKRVASEGRPRLRLFALGEYSPEALRPHYHVLAFNYWPAEVRRAGKSPAGKPIWTAAELTETWGHGRVIVQEADGEAANYCSRYVVDKLSGGLAAERLNVVDPATGEVVARRAPEFMRYPTRPGLAGDFVGAHAAQLVAHGWTVASIRGKRKPLPRYYMRKLAELDPAGVDELKAQRVLSVVQSDPHERSPERRAVRAEVLEARLAQRKRNVIDRHRR